MVHVQKFTCFLCLYAVPIGWIRVVCVVFFKKKFCHSRFSFSVVSCPYWSDTCCTCAVFFVMSDFNVLKVEDNIHQNLPEVVM